MNITANITWALLFYLAFMLVSQLLMNVLLWLILYRLVSQHNELEKLIRSNSITSTVFTRSKWSQ